MPQFCGAAQPEGGLLKIAVFHNALDTIGGAERVALTLGRDLPADVITAACDPEKIRLMGFERMPRSLGALPRNAPWRQTAAFIRFAALKLREKYDCHIIAGDWAVGAALRHRPSLWYVHSPAREIWDLKSFTRDRIVPPPARPAFDLWAAAMRPMYRDCARRAGRLVCNSRNTQARVRRYFDREARVIHPPVETSRFRFKESGDFWLSVNRTIQHKRIEMQFDAFRCLPSERLVMVGAYEGASHFGEYRRRMLREAPVNVEVRGAVPMEELAELYARCRGFITASVDEDFGLTAVEAMASGKPVIAPAEGGYLETVVPGETGVLIEGISAEKIAGAVRSLKDTVGRFRMACEARAGDFGAERFVREMREEIALAAR
jgi:glycosyltransferase involved in cell wall biosynthesis